MNLTRWTLAIGVLVGCGLLQVQGRHAVFLQGYAVGAQEAAVAASRTAVQRLVTDVDRLESPGRLAEAARNQKLIFVSRTVLPPPAPVALMASADLGTSP